MIYFLFNKFLGPVEAAFDIYEDFTLYKSGVYTHVYGDYLGGHDIKIIGINLFFKSFFLFNIFKIFIGWGTLNGVDYWLVTNNWTTIWDMEGFFIT